MAMRLHERYQVRDVPVVEGTEVQRVRSVRVGREDAGEREARLHPLATAALLALMTSPVWLPWALFVDLAWRRLG